MAAHSEQPKVYRANCHCTAFVYEFTTPDITSTIECNCSICYRKAYLYLTPSPGSYRVVKGDESALTSYTFGKAEWLHKFCRVCATPLFIVKNVEREGDGSGEVGEPRRGINARAVQGVDIRGLKRVTIDGAAMGEPHQPGVFTGPEPTAEFEGGRMYYGSCHCGEVTLALRSVPLDKNYPGPVVDCNCSICSRNGYVWIYPSVHQVSIQLTNPENLGNYTFNTGCVAKTFCKICGVNIGNVAMELNEGQLAKLGEDYKGLHERVKKMAPLNLRVLDGFHISETKEPEIATRGKEVGQPYIDP